MSYRNDENSIVDCPEVIAMIFYPRVSYSSKPDTRDHFMEVEKGIRIGCRF